MSAPARLAAFVVGLVLVFGASYVVAGAVVPDRVVEDWTRRAEQPATHDDPAGAHSVSTISTTSVVPQDHEDDHQDDHEDGGA